MALQLENFGDLLKTTQNDLGKPNFTELFSDYTEFTAAPQLIKKNRISIQAGAEIQWNIGVDDGDAAENVAITDQDQTDQVDGMVQAKIDWRKTVTKYQFFHEELLANREPARINDLVKFRRLQAQSSWTRKIERNFWAFPAAADIRTPFGVPYWCTKNATTGFNGGIPSGYSAVANLSPTTYPRWNNYTAQYVAVTADDFIRKARRMAEMTNFKPIVAGIPQHGTVGKQRAYYSNYTVVSKLEEEVDSRNDNLGPDIAKNDGAVMFRRVPVVRVPLLDDDTTDPLYQIDWGVMGMVVMNGMWMKETTLDPYPGQRNLCAVFLDSLYNFICYNRRALGVIATGVTYSY